MVGFKSLAFLVFGIAAATASPIKKLDPVYTQRPSSVDSNLQPLLDSLNNTVAQVLAGNLTGVIDAIGSDLEGVLNLLDGLTSSLLTVGKGPQPSAGPGPSPPPPDCLTTKQLTSIITKIVNELQPILQQIEAIPLLQQALKPVLDKVDAALTQVVVTLNKVIAEVLDLVCQVLKQVEGLLTHLGLGAVTNIIQDLIPL